MRRSAKAVRSIRRNLLLRSLVFAGASLFVGGSPCHADAAPELPEGLTPPRLLNTIDVPYPVSLQDLPEPPEGEVVVRFRIGTDGIPVDVVVAQGIHPDLDESVRRAVAALRYEPAQWHGQPVEITTGLTIPITAPRPPDVPIPSDSQTTEGTPPDTTRAATPSRGDASDDRPSRPAVDANSHGTLEGQLLAAGDRTPIAGATIVLAPLDDAWIRQTTTGPDGRFHLERLPAGPVRVVVVAPGFERETLTETVAGNEALQLKYFVRPAAINPYRTVVTSGANPREEVGRRTLTVAEVQRMPGFQGDALRALQVLPGVSRAPFGAGLLVVRGSAPFDTAVLVGDHVITFLFHFGALSTAIPTEILSTLEFIPGNFDARYGNHLGGVVRITPRAGRRDGFHGHAKLGLLDASFHVEGPVGKGSFILAARRSIVDLVLPLVVPDDAGLAFTQAPRYYDYQALLNYPLGGGELTARIFGADDRAVFVQSSANDEDVDVRNRSATTAWFHRADLEYRVERGRWFFLLTPSYRLERAEVVNASFFSFDVLRHNLSGRAELRYRLSRNVELTAGTETIASFYDIKGQAPPTFDFGSGMTEGSSASVTTDNRGARWHTALYATAQIQAGERVRIVPGVRATWYGEPMHRSAFDPRLRAAFVIAERTTLRAAIGLYSQEPAITQQSPTFGNPNLRPERALHTSVEVEQELPANITMSVSGFYKELWDRIAPSPFQVTTSDGSIQPEREANTQTGRIYGAELLVKKPPGSSPIIGWLSYTWLWSRVRDRPGEPEVRTDFVQSHVLNAVIGTALPRHWTVGARFQLTSGAPYTPVVGTKFDATTGDYVPIEGRRNNATLPLFHQLSIRVEKRWFWKWGSATAYLDLQNVYNNEPVEAYAYAFDYRSRAAVGGLPVVPWLGAKLEY